MAAPATRLCNVRLNRTEGTVHSLYDKTRNVYSIFHFPFPLQILNEITDQKLETEMAWYFRQKHQILCKQNFLALAIWSELKRKRKRDGKHAESVIPCHFHSKVYFCIFLTQRQMGLTTRCLHIQLDPFVSQLTICLGYNGKHKVLFGDCREMVEKNSLQYNSWYICPTPSIPIFITTTTESTSLPQQANSIHLCRFHQVELDECFHISIILEYKYGITQKKFALRTRVVQCHLF